MEDYGLVLAGGGARGVYQIGAWRALRELEIPITCVVGTSVGAMNGALVAVGQYEGAVALWESMSVERGFRLPEPLRVPDNLFSLRNADIVLRELVKNHGLDMSPLRRRLEVLVDEETLRASPIDYGLVTFEVNSRQGRYLYKDKIPQGQLIDYIMASAAYPGLRRPVIDGKSYLDGGLADNVPIRMLMRRHRNNIVVVNIADGGLSDEVDDPHLNLVYIQPMESLGNAFEFQPETAASKMEMGWYDTMKAFGKYGGEWMYFTNADYQRLRDELGENVVSGLEHAARLYGLDKLRVCPAEDFVRELMDCDRLSGEKFRAFRSHIDVGAVLKILRRGEQQEYNLTNDVLLQLAQGMVEDSRQRPRLRAMAQKVAPGIMRAAEAMAYLRRYTQGQT